jgi:hypothetical protein
LISGRARCALDRPGKAGRGEGRAARPEAIRRMIEQVLSASKKKR